MVNHFNDGLNQILRYYAEEYRKDGKVFVRTFLNCESIQAVCRAIAWVYRKELTEMRKSECVEYAKKFNTDQKTLGDILSIIYYILN